MTPKGGRREGAGRKPIPGGRREIISARVPPELAAWLRSEAEARGLSLGDVLTGVLDRARRKADKLSSTESSRLPTDAREVVPDLWPVYTLLLKLSEANPRSALGRALPLPEFLKSFAADVLKAWYIVRNDRNRESEGESF